MSVSRCSPGERVPLRHAYGLIQAKVGHSAQPTECPQNQQIPNFRELLPCVTLWMAALSQGSVGKILTHPPRPFMRCVERTRRDRGRVKC
jgi:hypothetical protein